AREVVAQHLVAALRRVRQHCRFLEIARGEQAQDARGRILGARQRRSGVEDLVLEAPAVAEVEALLDGLRRCLAREHGQREADALQAATRSPRAGAPNAASSAARFLRAAAMLRILMWP